MHSPYIRVLAGGGQGMMATLPNEAAAPETVLVFDDEGYVMCLYNETIPLPELGRLFVKRLSHIEFSSSSQVWQVLTEDGKMLYSHPSRDACLVWENKWFVSELLQDN